MESSYQTAHSSNTRYEEGIPAAGKRVMVSTADYRCLGYIDAEGVWRQSFSGERLRDVEGWEAIEDVH